MNVSDLAGTSPLLDCVIAQVEGRWADDHAGRASRTPIDLGAVWLAAKEDPGLADRRGKTRFWSPRRYSRAYRASWAADAVCVEGRFLGGVHTGIHYSCLLDDSVMDLVAEQLLPAIGRDRMGSILRWPSPIVVALILEDDDTTPGDLRRARERLIEEAKGAVADLDPFESETVLARVRRAVMAA